MYICHECGHIFAEPRYIEEVHGEKRAHCPECCGDDLDNAEAYQCDACRGITASPGEMWCEDCKATTRRIMNRSVQKSLKDSNLPMSSGWSVVDAYREVLEDKRITDPDPDARALLNSIVDIAEAVECGVVTAWDMAEQWVNGSAFMEYCSRRRNI